MADRLIIVSNRLPVVFEKKENEWVLKPGSGGLVAALAPVLSNRGGVWIGWPGIVDAEMPSTAGLLETQGRTSGYILHAVPLSDEELQLYYHGFSNEILWPLFHDLQSRCNFDPRYWAVYQDVNARYAAAIREVYQDGDFIWVHDYHILLAGRKMRELGMTSSIGFFLHIPFPSLDIFVKLPWRFPILQALLQYDLIGFQTARDRRNFISCVRELLPEVQISTQGALTVFTSENRTMRAGCFPISIDFQDFNVRSATREVSDASWYLHERYPERQILLGVDRLDYTKGIPFRLRAFRELLRRYPDTQRQVTLIQVVVPSRADIPEYNELKTEIERLVGEINGEFTQSGWVPIHYLYRHLGKTDLLAYYRTAEIALITPLKDGMNLVAKEFCATKIQDDGVLILSEFAGAASQLQRYALLVNPYDIEGVADTIYRAVLMPAEERRTRMRRMRASIKRHDVFWWVDIFLDVAFAKDLMDFPLMDEYVPTMENLHDATST